MNKRAKIMILGLLVTGLTAGRSLFAEDTHWDSSKRMEKMTKKLNLTTDQQAQIKQIMEETKTEAQEMRKKHDERILAVLNDEQKKKYEDMKSKMKERWKGKRDKTHAGNSGEAPK